MSLVSSQQQVAAHEYWRGKPATLQHMMARASGTTELAQAEKNAIFLGGRPPGMGDKNVVSRNQARIRRQRADDAAAASGVPMSRVDREASDLLLNFFKKATGPDGEEQPLPPNLQYLRDTAIAETTLYNHHQNLLKEKATIKQEIGDSRRRQSTSVVGGADSKSSVKAKTTKAKAKPKPKPKLTAAAGDLSTFKKKIKQKSNGEEKERLMRSSLTADKILSSAIDIVAMGSSGPPYSISSSQKPENIPAAMSPATPMSTRSDSVKALASHKRKAGRKRSATKTSNSIENHISSSQPSATGSGSDRKKHDYADTLTSYSTPEEANANFSNLSADDEMHGGDYSDSSDTPSYASYGNGKGRKDMDSTSHSSRENGDELNESNSNKSEEASISSDEQ